MNPTRRSLVATAGLLAGLPARARAQTAKKNARIGYLLPATLAGYETRIEALRAGLRERGWVEGKNLSIEFRAADGNYERLPAVAQEMVRQKPDVLVTNGTPATLALKAATSTIPIVMTAISDPVATGVVKSLARPDANITGTTFFVQEMVAKRLEMLREALPKMRRAALLSNPGNASTRITLRDVETAAKTLRIEVRNFDVGKPDEFDQAFAAMKAWGAEAVVVVDDPVLNANAGRIGALATARRLPSNGQTALAKGGGLMSYNINQEALFRRAAHHIDRILRGAKPADLPIEQPTTFELILNQKAAQALGIKFPQSLLVRADEVIE